MTKPQRIVALGTLVLLLLSGSSLAQDLKLRPTRPIYIDSLGAGLNAPEGVAFDDTFGLIVADSGNRRFVRFDVSDGSVSPRSEFSLTEVSRPVHVRFGSAGEILALDGRSHEIARIGADGKFLRKVEIEPVEGRRSALIKSFDVDDDGRLYALDENGSRIVVLDETDKVVRSIAFAPEVEFLSDLTVNGSGVVFAIDSVGRRVFVARKDDAALTPLTDSMDEDLAFPTSIAADGTGYLYIADASGDGIVVVGENGTFRGRYSGKGRTQGFLWHPAGVAADRDYLFVADRGNNRVQLFLIVR